MNSGLVSICIPAFNAGPFIRTTLESLSRQSYEEIEVIVSDNSSTDDTGEVAREFATRDRRFRYSRNETNVGYVGNIWKAVEIAKSDMVAIFHADDAYARTIVEKEAAILAAKPSVAGVFSRFRMFEGDVPTGELETTANYGSMLPYDEGSDAFVGVWDDFIPALLNHGNFFVCPSFMTRKEVFEGIGGFTDRYPAAEDMELWIRYLKAGHELAILDKELTYYRQSPGQGSAFWGRQLLLPAFYNVMDDLVIPTVDPASKYLTVYNAKKAKAYLKLALRTEADTEKYLSFVNESKKVFLYPLNNNKGGMQRFPLMARAFLRIVKGYRKNAKSAL